MKFKDWLLSEELKTLDTTISVPEELEHITHIMQKNFCKRKKRGGHYKG